jgi:hypothetical protein
MSIRPARTAIAALSLFIAGTSAAGAHVALETPDGDRLVVATRSAGDLEALVSALGGGRVSTSRPLRELGRYPSLFGVVMTIGVAVLAGVLVGGPRYAAWPIVLGALAALALAVAYPLRTRCRVEVRADGLLVRRRARAELVARPPDARVESAFDGHMIVATTDRVLRFGGTREAILDVVVAARAASS